MKRSKKVLLGLVVVFGVLLLCALALGARSDRGPRDIPAGTGFSALDLCTRTQQSGERFEHVRDRYVVPKTDTLSRIWRVEFQPGVRVAVSTRLPFLTHERVAIYRKGLGCTIVPPGTSEASVRAQPFRPAPALAPDPRPWPSGEAAAEPLPERMRPIVERHAQRIFGEETGDLKRRRNATALLVAQDGHLVFERYGQGYTRDQPQLGWSMTKSLTAIIGGLFAHDGKLALDAPVGLARWQGTAKAGITWRSLLNMAPGLAWDEGYGGASDATEMLFSQPDEGTWAADRPVVAEPGRVFNYSTGFTNIAALRMRELIGGTHQALYDFYQSRLFAPLGIRGGVIEPDASGTPVGGARGILRPVDWLRLGQLVENRGVWNGEPILPAAYVDFMLGASPASAGYGGFLWRQPAQPIEPGLRASLPADLVFFAGHLGQFVVIIPSRKLLVLRMGVDIGSSIHSDGALAQVLELARDLVATPN